MTRRQVGRDDGVYAALYAALVIVLLGMAAIVVDLAQVRQERRIDRSAADSAAIAGAAYLNPAKALASPNKACVTAWQYLSTTLQISTPAGACTAFPTTFPNSCPASLIPAEVAVPGTDLKIQVSWPIPRNANGGFLTPDIAPGSVSQPFAPGTDATTGRGDGTDAGCERLGVAIFHTAKFQLATAFGATNTHTQVHSVARYVFLPGNEEYNYPLVVLDPHACSALSTNGSGADILVQNGATAVPPNPNLPGRIAVDSDGVGCNQYILSVNGAKGYIQAEDGQDAASNSADQNAIEIYSTTVGAPANSYTGVSSPCQPTDALPSLASTPCVARVVARTERVTRAPFDLKFKARVDQLVTSFGSVQATKCIPKKCGGTWSITSNGTLDTWQLITGSACGNDFTGTTTPGYYFVNCPAEQMNWTLGKTFIFPSGSKVIVNGDLNLQSGGCFAVNTSSCAPLADTSLTGNSIVSVRGDINASGGGKLILPGTFLSQVGPSGTQHFDATGMDQLFWTAPYGDKTTMGTTCAASAFTGEPPVECFRNLAYWTESATLDKIQGGGTTPITLEGTFFLGQAPLQVGGTGLIQVTQSQFVALTVTTGGTKPLTFTPDPARTTGVPRSGVALIR